MLSEAAQPQITHSVTVATPTDYTDAKHCIAQYDYVFAKVASGGFPCRSATGAPLLLGNSVWTHWGKDPASWPKRSELQFIGVAQNGQAADGSPIAVFTAGSMTVYNTGNEVLHPMDIVYLTVPYDAAASYSPKWATYTPDPKGASRAVARVTRRKYDVYGYDEGVKTTRIRNWQLGTVISAKDELILPGKPFTLLLRL